MKPSRAILLVTLSTVLCLIVLGQTTEGHGSIGFPSQVQDVLSSYGSESSDPLIPWKQRPVLGRIKTLVLPVQFSDVRLRSSISKISSSMDSINSWFRASSYGKMEFDFFISRDIVTLPRTMAFYGTPESGYQRGDSTDRLDLYFENSLSIVWQRTKIDLKDYKNIVLVHAGSDEAETQNPNDLWSSCSGVGPVGDETGELVVRARDGSLHSVWGIATFSEDDLESTWIHELAHTLGITDLYIYDEDGYSEWSGVGYWSLMDAGSMLDPPPDIDGWNKYILGWIEPVTISLPKGEQIIYTLDSTKSPKSLLIKIDNNDNEYYFVQARRKAGTDVSLPSEGVVVFRMNRMRERSYAGSELALVIDANFDTPKECVLLSDILFGCCESLDAPYNKGRTYLFTRGRLSVNVILENSVFWDDKAKIIFKAESVTADSFKITLGRSPQEIGVENARPLTIRHPPVTTVTTGTAITVYECVIASAAYGSELAPEVQFLRVFRDRYVQSTFAGRNFMKAFNLFYYSFSPAAASLVAESSLLSQIVRLTLYPLLMALRASSAIFQLLCFSPETAIVISGAFASTFIGLAYSVPFLVIVKMCTRRRQRVWDSVSKRKKALVSENIHAQ